MNVNDVSETQPKRRRRIFPWVFLGIQALFLVWIIAGINAVSSGAGQDCGTLSAQACSDAAAVGGGIGALLIVFLWLATDVILGIGYLIFRRRG